jgi:hypothetical protein
MSLNEALQSHGFTFRELLHPQGLERLDTLFRDRLRAADAPLEERLLTYRRQADAFSAQQTSELLLDLAPHVEAFIGSLFGIDGAIDSLRQQTLSHDPVFRFKAEFVQKRARKRGDESVEDFPELSRWLRDQLPADAEDVELAVAEYALSLLEAVEDNV